MLLLQQRECRCPTEAARLPQAVAEWEAKAAERDAEYAKVGEGMEDGEEEPSAPAFMAYVPLPEQEEIEARVRSCHTSTTPPTPPTPPGGDRRTYLPILTQAGLT